MLLLASSVVLPGLTCLRSFVFYTGFLLNPAFSTKLLFSRLNHRTAKPFSICLISSSCVFHLANRPFVCQYSTPYSLPSAHLKSSGRFVFFYQSLLLWSNLPYTLRHSSYISLVKSTLKTHVFSTGECVGWGGGWRARACLYSK